MNLQHSEEIPSDCPPKQT